MAGDETEGAGGCLLAEARLPEQRKVDGKLFPLVLTPPSPSESVIDACELLHTCRAFLEQKLKEHGALLLRGFPLRNGSDFHSAVESLGWQTRSYIGSAPRSHVVGSVYTANDADPDKFINFHHEMSQIADVATWPSKVLFFCETPPLERGQTPLVMSHKVTQGVWMQCPDFMQKLEDLGLLYLKVQPLEKDLRYISLQGWPTVLGTSDRKEAEERAKEIFNSKVEWLPGGDMKLVTGPAKATRNFGREHNAWCNTITIFYSGTSHKIGISLEHPYDVVFGDGSPLPADAVETSRKILEENSVDIPWKQGDLMILDNFSVLHGRRAYKPPRQILVTLCR
ncbi:hypothetical protein GOP47_0012613 [Adiantum capillus-veneris]|uniref:TauD/TfdA-like domain-containing protein n=1 Tax=Adiantum capillus-veneris TaxID=13818 RepID=A0A9D4US40_ADICA|nr:hypothetical protein GOP47_0012613 [Adiantum capillus-veneris]